MPRGIPKNEDEKKKANIQKAKDGMAANELVEFIDKLKSRIEKDLLEKILTHPAVDIEGIQNEYKAVIKLLKELAVIVAEGKIASDKLHKEDK